MLVDPRKPGNRRPADPSADDKAASNDIEAKRSRVRRWLSYMAGIYIFAGGGALTGYYVAVGRYEAASDLFLTVLAVAAGIVGYWFADRK